MVQHCRFWEKKSLLQIFFNSTLIYLGRVTHICFSKLTTIGSDNGLLPSYYMNQCWKIVNWTLRNKLQWNLNQNSYIFIQENAFENFVWQMVAISNNSMCEGNYLAVAVTSPCLLICIGEQDGWHFEDSILKYICVALNIYIYRYHTSLSGNLWYGISNTTVIVSEIP